MSTKKPIVIYNGELGELGTGDVLVGIEASLGNPSVSGYVLVSTDTGVRSWVQGGSSDFSDTVIASLL